MSLITEINRTNTSKEKAKKDKVNINNKLVSLGGQSATDLSNVPEKIEQMVTGNYKKVAFGNCNVEIPKNLTQLNIRMNLNFTPKKVFLGVRPNINGDAWDADRSVFIHYVELPINSILYFWTNGNKIFCVIDSASFNSSQITVNIKYDYVGGQITNWVAIG